MAAVRAAVTVSGAPVSEPGSPRPRAFSGAQRSSPPRRCSTAELLAALPDALTWCRPLPAAVAARAVGTVGWLQRAAVPDVAVIGCAAMEWLGGLDDADREQTLQHLQAGGTRCLIADASSVARLDAWLGHSDVALAATRIPLPELLHALRRALLEGQAPATLVYGGLMDVFGLGVLIAGPAGIGKSELALELLARGHRLVGDDAIEVVRLPGGLLLGRAPELLRGFLEVRGLGVLDVVRMYGETAVLAQRRIDFMLELRPVEQAPVDYRARLAGLRRSEALLDCDLPTICLPVRVGHNLATLVEAACRDQWLRLGGHRAEEVFAHRQQQAIDAQRPNESAS